MVDAEEADEKQHIQNLEAYHIVSFRHNRLSRGRNKFIEKDRCNPSAL